MSLYTVGEVVVWLLLAAALGVVLGWLLRSARGDALRDRSGRPAARPRAERSRSDRVAAFTAPDGGEPLPPVADPRPAPTTPDHEVPPATAGQDAGRQDDAPSPPKGARKPSRGGSATVASGAFRGSALPGRKGEAPAPEYVVKATVDSMTYHLPGTSSHARVHADVWFKDVDAARAAGFRPPPSQV